MLTAISLFTGAGGLDLGFEAAGFRIAACVELDPDARQTIRENRPGWGLLDQGDIHLLKPRELLRSRQLGERKLDLIIAGPPCQAFSKSALWSKGITGRLEDPRAKVFDPLLNLVESVVPSAVVVENVKGIITGDDVISKFQDRLAKINTMNGTRYLLNTVCLNALDFGVPQKRERAFLIAFRDGRKFSPPTKTHAAAQAGETHRTAWDAIGDLDGFEQTNELTLRGKWADIVPSIPEGSNYLHHTAKGDGLPLFGWRTRYWTFLLKLSKNQPSWTLQAQPGPATGPFHWKNRQLTIREMCRLQTFPDHYKICGSYRSARRQIGNAVPAALAEAVARQVRYYLDGTTFTGAASLAMPQRPGCPSPEPPQALPREYLRLVGTYSAHPGTGRGPRAMLRSEWELAPEAAE